MAEASNENAHLLTHLSSDVRQSLLAVEAQSFQASVSQHLRYLRVLLPILTED